jgi:hypothetical protein
MRALVAIVLTLHAVLLLHSLRRNFVTVDEFGYLAAGVSHWDTGTYGMYRVNPPLPRMLAVLPVLAARPQRDYHRLTDVPGERSEWTVGHDFLAANEARYFDLVCLGRLAGLAWSLAGALLVFRWAWEIYGPPAGFTALVLWCFGPNVLAHAQLLTPDVPAAAAALAATYAFWRYLRRPSFSLACLCGALLGIAQLTKYTLLVLYAVWPVLGLLAIRARRADPGGSRMGGVKIAHGLVMLLLSILVINAGYGFSDTCRPLGEFRFVSRTLGGEPADGRAAYSSGRFGNRFRDSWVGEVPVPLPADYLLGIDVQRRDFEVGLRSYLAGTWRSRGWWYYYLYALAVKVPLGFWAIGLWGAWLGCVELLRSGPGDRLGHRCVWLPVLAVVGLVSSATGFNHHLRYVLPALPFLAIGASRAARCLQSVRVLPKLLLGALLGWGVLSSLLVYPCSLSYFNELAGGPANGHRHLLDSNIDWGQDALRLKEWLDDHPEARPLRLAYFNSVDPRIIGLEFTLPEPGPKGVFTHDPEYTRQLGPHPGYMAISVNLLHGMPWSAPDGRGNWRAVHPEDYAYLRQFQPIARAGYSICIYHITLEEANRVREQYGLPPLTGQPEQRPPPPAKGGEPCDPQPSDSTRPSR